MGFKADITVVVLVKYGIGNSAKTNAQRKVAPVTYSRIEIRIKLMDLSN